MLLYTCITESEYDSDGSLHSIIDGDDHGCNVSEVIVYSIKTDSWSRVQDCHYDPVEPLPGVLFNKRLHWLGRKIGDLDDSMVIAAFNFLDKNFMEVHLPATFDFCEVDTHQMLVLGVCLCLGYLAYGWECVAFVSRRRTCFENIRGN